MNRVHQQKEGSMETEEQSRDVGNEHSIEVCEGHMNQAIGAVDSSYTERAPEKKLILFALRLAILEKAASGVGALGFIWATVVLLGGFAITLERKDFWSVTVILLVESARIFSRSHELEWRQHQSFNHPKNQLLPEGMSRALYWLQFVSAFACAILSVIRLSQQDYGNTADGESTKLNRRPALNIFYALSLSEALLFLAERAFWEWNFSHRRLLQEVNRECGLGPAGLISLRRFFYRAYSLCLKGSIFDGIKMNLVGFAEGLLISGSADDRLISLRVLLRFVTDRRFEDGTLRKIGTSPEVMERLVEMLNWKGAAEVEMRTAAAVIVSKLAAKKRNALRVAGISGAIQSISSLLYAGCAGNAYCLVQDGANPNRSERLGYNQSALNLLGLSILRKLASDLDNCGKIGNTRGLLPKIISQIPLHRSIDSDSDIEAARRSLQLLKLLAGTTGPVGELLRREISEIAFTIPNIREILQNGAEPLQMLGAEIIASLAMDAEARERIGATGGMIRVLARIFLGEATNEEQARVQAGEAVAMLILGSHKNCAMALRAAEGFAQAAGHPLYAVTACRILTNLCAYGDTSPRIIQAFPKAQVLNAVMSCEMKRLEASIGLAAQLAKLMSQAAFSDELKSANISENELAERLLHILQKYNHPSIKTPSLRRHVVELSICLMESDPKYVDLFDSCDLAKELLNVAETTTDLESFISFSGFVGLARHTTALTSLVDTALLLLATT